MHHDTLGIPNHGSSSSPNKKKNIKNYTRPLMIRPKPSFNFINHEALWKVLLKFGCPGKFITILRLLYDEMTAIILCNDSETEPLVIWTGIKRGCAITPILLSIFLAVIKMLIRDQLTQCHLHQASDGWEPLQPPLCLCQKKLHRSRFMELQFADDCAIVMHT